MKWLATHGEWLYAAAILALSGYSFADGDRVGGIVCAGVAVVTFVLLRWFRRPEPPTGGTPPTFEQGELDLIKKMGVEPIPIPGEEHSEAECSYCNFMKGGYR